MLLLAQFQERYPTASLLSKLLTIYQGKFVIQVSIQIEGVIRSTGMAAAETIELAEDQARARAIGAIPLNIPEQIAPPENSIISVPEPANLDTFEVFGELESDRVPTTADFTENYPEFTSDNFSPPATDVNEDFEFEPLPPTNTTPVTAFNNVTPFVLRTVPADDAPLLDDNNPPGIEFDPALGEPIDLSDTLIAIETELKNLRWTAKQERNYLERIYSKESRDLLSTQQLYEFLNYLQVFGQTSKELARLGWDNQQGQNYLVQNYNKRSRQYLSYQELKEFLQHLQATN